MQSQSTNQQTQSSAMEQRDQLTYQIAEIEERERVRAQKQAEMDLLLEKLGGKLSKSHRAVKRSVSSDLAMSKQNERY